MTLTLVFILTCQKKLLKHIFFYFLVKKGTALLATKLISQN